MEFPSKCAHRPVGDGDSRGCVYWVGLLIVYDTKGRRLSSQLMVGKCT